MAIRRFSCRLIDSKRYLLSIWNVEKYDSDEIGIWLILFEDYAFNISADDETHTGILVSGVESNSWQI